MPRTNTQRRTEAGRRRITRPIKLPAQFGAGAKITAPTSGYSGHYPSRGRTA
jgi:hypothetical protein